MHHLPLPLLAVALLPLVGCPFTLHDPFTLHEACTLMGCGGTLTITLDRALADDAIVAVDMGEDDLRDCTVGDDSGACTITELGGVTVLSISTEWGQAPETFDLELSEGGSDVVSYIVEPTWSEPHFPNGEACDGPDGGCRSASVNLAL